MGSSPKAVQAAVPAKRPERAEGVAVADVILGGADNLGEKAVVGKKSLIRPSGFTSLNLGG